MKMRRGRNGLTKAEFLRRDAAAAMGRLFDKTMANIAKKKAKAEKEKCYPVPHGDVSTCPKNEQGYCSLFDKKCNNILVIEGEEPK